MIEYSGELAVKVVKEGPSYFCALVMRFRHVEYVQSYVIVHESELESEGGIASDKLDAIIGRLVRSSS